VISNGVVERLAFRQSDPLGRGLTWPQQLRVVIGRASGERTMAVELTGAVADVTGAAGMAPPRYILPTGGGRAYGDFVLD